MEKSRTAIVILNWNGKHLLSRFLPQILRYTPSDVEIIVADNASEDDSLAFLASRYPNVRVITLDRNYGYAGGYNRALKQVDADYYMLLNSDMAVSEAWLEPCVRLLDERPEVAACQPKIRSLHDSRYFEYAGAAGGFVDHFGYPFCRGRIFHHLEEDQGQYDTLREVFWATGAAMFVRAGAFHKAGGFDEQFFAHMEEVDLCWRLQNKGFRIFCCPDSVVYHLGGGSLPRNNPRKTFYNFRNSLWMLAKNLPGHRFYTRILQRLALDELAAASFLLKGQIRDCLAVYKAHLAFFRYFFRMRKKSCHNPHILPSILYKRSIVLDYYVRGKKRFSDLCFKASIASK